MAAAVYIESVFLLCLDLSRANAALVLRFRGLGLYELTHHELYTELCKAAWVLLGLV